MPTRLRKSLIRFTFACVACVARCSVLYRATRHGSAHTHRHDEDWRALIESARERQVYVRAMNDSFRQVQQRLGKNCERGLRCSAHTHSLPTPITLFTAATPAEEENKQLPALPKMVKRKAEAAFGRQSCATGQHVQKRAHEGSMQPSVVPPGTAMRDAATSAASSSRNPAPQQLQGAGAIPKRRHRK